MTCDACLEPGGCPVVVDHHEQTTLCAPCIEYIQGMGVVVMPRQYICPSCGRFERECRLSGCIIDGV
jgi:hypothetical protein